MPEPELRLWKIVRVSGVMAVLFGLFYLTLSPAWSSAMVESLQKLPPQDQFIEADKSLFRAMCTVGGIQIAHGLFVLVCAAKALKGAKVES